MAIRRTGSQTLVNRGVTAAAATPVNIITGTGGPTVNISSIQIANSTFVAKDDLAIDTAGGYMIINGTGFQSGAVVYIQGTAATSTAFVSSSRLNVTVPALSSGLLDVYVVNTDGSGSIYLQSLNANGTPSWTTTSPLTSQDADAAFAINLVASGAAGDGTITYAVSSGSTLPSGTFLASNGYFYGTVSGIQTETTYSFSVDAIDAQNQETARSFNITVRAGDSYFKDTVLLLNGEITNNTWITDASSNAFTLTVNGDTRPSAFSPYETVWSNYFDGTGDYLTVPSNTGFAFGTGNFTVEAWVYLTATPTFGPIFISSSTGTGNSLHVQINSANKVRITNASTEFLLATNAISLNTWTHIAVVRNGTTLSIYQNGVLNGTTTNSTSFTENGPTIGYEMVGGNYYFTGYISSLRVVKDTAVYTSNFTPSTTPLTAIPNTSLLTCQSNRLIDNSTNNFTITKNGDVTVSNFGPFVETDISTGSAYFDGTGDYLTVADNTSLDAFADFTIECWAYWPSTTAGAFQVLLDKGWNNGSFGAYLLTLVSGVLKFYAGSTGTSWDIANALTLTTPTTGQWYHIAVTRSGSSGLCFINGVQVNTFTSSTALLNSSVGLGIGAAFGGASPINGYISNVRILKGAAVYTGNFIPPNQTLTVSGSSTIYANTSNVNATFSSANTSLLTLQSRIGENNNRFIDTSGINHSITRSGNTSQGTFSPFQRGGWSNYFDGTGDYLTVASSSEFGLGTGNFTFECWLYPTANPTNGPGTIFDARSGINAEGYVIRSFNDRTIGIYTSSGSYVYSTGTITLNTWNHVALVRTSTSTNGLTFYINGNAAGTATVSQNLGTTWSPLIGYNRAGSGYEWNGYISNLRVLKGTALYTSNFTAPTLPLTAVANTSLLTCADSGFIDKSPNNFTITRNGDVSVQPFSPFKVHTYTANTHSVYFDGTGDSLNVSSSMTAPGANNFTIEGWIWVSSESRTYNQTIFDTRTSASSTSGFSIALLTNGKIAVRGGNPESTTIETNTSVNLNDWNHFAVNRYNEGSSIWEIYLNGIYDAASVTGSFTASDTNYQIGKGAASNSDFKGYISNLRYNRSIVYNTNFTANTVLTVLANTKLLTCASNTIVDLSAANTGNTAYAITVNGDARATTVNPLGFTVTTATATSAQYSITDEGGSMYFDGTGDYLTVPNNSGLQMGTGNFTIEFWIYYNSIASYQTPFSKGYTAAGDLLLQTGNGNGVMMVWLSGTAVITEASGATVGQWYHYALVRSGTTVTLYRNGVSRGTATSSVNFNTTDQLGIGATGKAPAGGAVGYFPVNGYMSSVRVVKGTALYTSGFVPPVAPPLPIAESSLLINGTNGGIIDYTRKNNLETVGDVKIRNNITKFGNTSMYFDGTGDYLKIPNSPTFEFLSENFTLEFWIYPTSNPSEVLPISRTYDGLSYSFAPYLTAGTVKFLYNGLTTISSSHTLTLNVWTHIAYVRNSNTLTIYVNGTNVGSGSITVPITASSRVTSIGAREDGNFPFAGYLDDVRITKGVARYTSNFSAPNKHPTN